MDDKSGYDDYVEMKRSIFQVRDDDGGYMYQYKASIPRNEKVFKAVLILERVNRTLYSNMRV
jgi:hypothetical protein